MLFSTTKSVHTDTKQNIFLYNQQYIYHSAQNLKLGLYILALFVMFIKSWNLMAIKIHESITSYHWYN